MPVAALVAAVRSLFVILLLLAQTVLVEGLLVVFVRRSTASSSVPFPLRGLTTAILQSPLPPVHAALTRACNASIARLVLAVLGVVYITVDTVQLRKTGRSPPTVPFDPRKGDLIIANSSSPLDLLYLAFRYNATFLLPVASSSRIAGWRRVTLLSAILASGQLPQSGTNAESLDEAVKKAAGPVVVFPEVRFVAASFSVSSA